MCILCYLCLTNAIFLFVFVKQKTAYEMRISDWSSDVCSSDLAEGCEPRRLQPAVRRGIIRSRSGYTVRKGRKADPDGHRQEQGRCRRNDRIRHARRPALAADDERSEEHTSELQSLMRISYAVFCLKKKKKKHHPVLHTLK